MSSMQYYLMDLAHNHLLRTATFAKPTELWLALFTTRPNKTGVGGVEVSTSGTGYARLDVSPADANFSPVNTGGYSANLIDFIFGVPTADWGTVTSWGIADAQTGGNFLVADDLTQQRSIYNGDLAPRFPAGAFTITWV